MMNTTTQDKPNTANSKPAEKSKKAARRDGEKKPPKKITETYLHNAGLYYLQRFAASKAHFRTVMGRKVKRSCHVHKDQDYEACMTMLDALVEKFENAGLLDDGAYLRGMITSLRRRGLSQKMIYAKLQSKGLTGDKIRTELETFDRENCDNSQEAELLAALRQARKKRLGPFDSLEKSPPEKALAALARAGFSYDTAQKALEMPLEDAEEKLREGY